MGYSHYWRRPAELPAEAFASWSANVARIIAATSVSIAGPRGEGKPIVTPTLVAFNGNSRHQRTKVVGHSVAFRLRQSEGGTGIEPYDIQPVPASTWEETEAQESFYMPQTLVLNRGEPNERGMYFDMTKTNGKPYDEVVTASLVLLAHHFTNSCIVTSDGKARDWLDGIALVELATGLHLGIPFYGHWWERPPRYDHDMFSAWSADVAKIVKATDVLLAGPEATGEPRISPDEVALNGVGRNGCEMFYVSRDHPSPSHCRTGQQPYDAVVTASLILLAHHIPETYISSYSLGALLSQSGPDEFHFESAGEAANWLPGLHLARAATGLDLKMPMIK